VKMRLGGQAPPALRQPGHFHDPVVAREVKESLGRAEATDLLGERSSFDGTRW
jgi:hypothetical protein